MLNRNFLQTLGVMFAVVLSAMSFVNSQSSNTPSPTPSASCVGIPGSPGPTGSPGASGSPGPSGSPGASGAPGANGSSGSNGKPGTTGQTGATGADGICSPGLTGPAGQSAYQLWLDLGNTGTESDFIASLQGSAGPQGATGSQGSPGTFTAIANQNPASYTGNPLWLVNPTTIGFSQNNFTSIANLDYAQFDTTATGVVPAVGKMWWDATDGTMNIGLKGGNVTLQVGQEFVNLVLNKSGSTMVDGTAVYVKGAQGQRLEVGRALGNSDDTSASILGLVTEPIANNQQGFVTVRGLVRGINLNDLKPAGETWAEGDALYVSDSVPGGLTNIKPIGPAHLILMGFVVIGGNNGTIYVMPQNGYELSELHDLRILNPAQEQYLRYNATLGVWENVGPGSVCKINGSTGVYAWTTIDAGNNIKVLGCDLP